MTTVLWCILFSYIACFGALIEGGVKGGNMWNSFGQNQNCTGNEETVWCIIEEESDDYHSAQNATMQLED